MQNDTWPLPRFVGHLFVTASAFQVYPNFSNLSAIYKGRQAHRVTIVLFCLPQFEEPHWFGLGFDGFGRV